MVSKPGPRLRSGTGGIHARAAPRAHRHVGRPDVIASVCFLVSSVLAWYEVSRGWAA